MRRGDAPHTSSGRPSAGGEGYDDAHHAPDRRGTAAAWDDAVPDDAVPDDAARAVWAEEPGAAEGDSADAEPLDTEPLDAEPLDAEPLDTEVVDGELVDGGSAEARWADDEPVYAEVVEDEPVHSGSTAVVPVDPRAARSARLRSTLASSRRGAARRDSAASPATSRSASPVAAASSGPNHGARPERPASGAPRGAGAAGGSVVSAGLAARLAEREAFERRRRLKRTALGLAVVAALAALAWAVFLSPLFALEPERIEVRGASEYVDSAEVAAIAAQEAGTPLPRLSTGDLAERIGALPPVGGATVLRDWPRGLTIELDSRVPVAVAADAEGVALVDGAGVVVAVVDAAPEGLPQLAVPLVPPEATTAAARDARETVAAVLEVLRVLPDALREQVATAGGSSPATVTLTLHGGATVQWGSAADTELKAAVLEVLVDQQPARVYDVSVPDRPTTS